jgi:hyperosmotically inducible periplasmic protein
MGATREEETAVKHEEPTPGRPGETSQWPRWEGPAETRPSGYLQGETNIFAKEPEEKRASVTSGSHDPQLAMAVKEALTQDALLDPTDITVSVGQGVVSLDSTVDSEGDRQRAGECVYNINGVSSCNNNLTIAGDQA